MRVTWKHTTKEHNKGISDDQKFRIIWTSKSDSNQESLEVQVQKITIKDLLAAETYEFKVDYLSKDRNSECVTKTITTGM